MPGDESSFLYFGFPPRWSETLFRGSGGTPATDLFLPEFFPLEYFILVLDILSKAGFVPFCFVVSGLTPSFVNFPSINVSCEGVRWTW
jgi:hypothetical protein